MIEVSSRCGWDDWPRAWLRLPCRPHKNAPTIDAAKSPASMTRLMASRPGRQARFGTGNLGSFNDFNAIGFILLSHWPEMGDTRKAYSVCGRREQGQPGHLG